MTASKFTFDDVPCKICVVLRQTGDYGVYGYSSEGRELLCEPVKTKVEAEELLREAASAAMLDVVRRADGELIAE